MAEVENLILNAQVIDNFSSNLDELKRELGEVEALGESADVNIDAHIAGAMAELHAIEGKIRQVDKMEAEPEIDVEGGMADKESMWGMFRMLQGTGVDERTGLLENPGLHGNPYREGRLANLDIPDVDADDWRRIFFGQRGTQSLAGAMNQGISPFDSPERFPEGRGAFYNLRRTIRKIGNLQISMGDLMNVVAGIIPLLIIFAGTLPAAIAGLAALAGAAIAAAGALFGVVGLAIGGMAFQGGEFAPEQLTEQLSDLADVFVESFSPLMNALEPLAQEIFRHAEFFIRDLATRMSVLLDMTEMAGGAVGWLSETLPPFLQEMAMFGQAVAPVMEYIMGGIGQIDWFGIMADIIPEIIGPMSLFVGILMRMAPIIYEISVRFMGWANTLLGLLGIVATIIDTVPGLAPVLGTLAALILLSASATFLWSSRLGVLIKQLTVLLVRGIYQAILGLWAWTSAQYGVTAAILSTVAALTALISLLTFGIGPLASAVFGGLFGMGGGGVGEIGSSLDNFEDRRRRTGQSANWASDRTSGYTEYNSTIVAPDKDTGLATANSQRFFQDSETTNQSDVDNRKHSE